MTRPPPTALLLALLPCCVACGAVELVRIAEPTGGAGEPRIRELIDLGGLPLPASGSLDQRASDGVLTPGEHVALLGQRLAFDETRVTIGGREAPVVGYLAGGSVLVRVPRGLTPLTRHRLVVETPHGRDECEVEVRAHLIVSDTRANLLRIWRTAPPGDEEPFDPRETSFELARVRDHAIAPAGALLYAVAAKPRAAGEYRLIVVHLGAADRPRKVGEVSLRLDAPPVALAASRDGPALSVLTERSLVLLDLADPLAPAARGTLALPAERDAADFTALALLGGDDRAVVLDASANRVLAVDVADPAAPRLLEPLALAPPGERPVAIDLAPDCADPNALWVVTGPNARLASGALRSLVDRTPAPGAPSEATVPAELPPGRLLRLSTDGERLAITQRHELPRGFVPLFLRPDPDGGVLISGTGLEVFDLASLELSVDGVLGMLDWLKRTLALGKILRVDPAGAITTELEAPALFLRVARLGPDGPLLYSVIKPAPRFLPPSIGVDLSIDAHQRQNLRLRELEWTALVPPYVAAPLTLQ